MITMGIVDQGIVFSGTRNSRRAILSFSSLVQLSSGKIIASFQAASRKNAMDAHILLSHSVDGGKTWAEPFAPFADGMPEGVEVLHIAYLSEVEPGRLMANFLCCDHFGDPSLDFFNPDTCGILPISIHLAESVDDGLTWTPLRKMDAGELNSTPIPIMGPISRISEQELVCPFETSKTYSDSGPWLHKAGYFRSFDDGKTWPEYRIVAHDPESKILYWDHRIANFGNGVMIDMLWAYDNVHHRELNAHMCKTTDGGKTWSQPVDTGLVGQPWPIVIDETTFLVVCVDRHISQTIRVVMTDDLGKSWDDASALLLYDHQQKQQERTDSLGEHLVEMGSWSYGLASGIKLFGGDVLFAFYAGNAHTTDICWCRGAWER